MNKFFSYSREHEQLKFVILGIKLKFKIAKNYLPWIRRNLIFKTMILKNWIFSPFKKQRVYKLGASFGRNCEYAFIMTRIYNYIESTLYTWAVYSNRNNFLKGIKNNEEIFTGDISFDKSLNMWECLKTNTNFHGNVHPADITNEEEKEREKQNVITKIRYLAKKNLAIYNSKDKKLYALTLDAENIKESIYFIEELYRYLSGYDKNFDMLIVIENNKACDELIKLEKKYDNLFIRKVCMFDPKLGSCNILPVKYYNDWSNIVHEFKLVSDKSKKKKLKFD